MSFLPAAPSLRAGVGLAALALAFPAVAQTGQVQVPPEDAAAPTVDEQQTSAEGTTAEGGAITVTGSRIRRPELVGLEPTLSISDEYFRDRNLTNVGDALNELPQFRGSVTPRGVQSSFGNGVNFINTFGLGSNRTLTLVNGRRVVSSNLPSLFGPGGAGVQVDLNIIPSVLVDRIDNVSVGGAPVYGSDAIAGTVNIILKNRYEGLTLNATSGITSRGDTFNYNVSGVAGRNFDEGRGNVTLAVAYDKADGLRATRRKHQRDNLGFLNNCTTAGTTTPINDGRVNPNIGCNTGANDGIPARILFRDLRSPFLSQSGVILSPDFDLIGFQFGEGGNLIPTEPGTQLTGFFQSGGNTYNTVDQTNLTSDLKRFTVNGFASYEITDGVELFFEGLYYKARSKEEGNNPSFNTFVFDPDTSGGLTFDTATTPFISPATRAFLLGQGFDTFNVSRSNEDLFDNGARSETELKRGVVGVRGDFGAFGRSLNYEASFNYGTNRIDNFQQNINQQRFINAVSFTQGPNGPVCTATPPVPVAPDQPVQPIADANCVPLNLFGFRAASPEALAYIREDTIEAANIRQYVFNANVGGDLFDLWAGPVAFNIGYEHRDEKASFTPSSFTQNGGGRGAAIAPTRGRYNVDEVFGEVLVPLVSPENGVPLINSAEVFGRIRYVDNTVNGGFTSWAAGGKIEILPDIGLRGNFTRSFRAPAITELFLPQSPTFERPTDLCTAQARNAGPAPDIRSRNCNAFLQATGNNSATYTLLAAQASVAGLSGGNPNLENEKADSYTFGTIIRPRFVRGLTITADYVNIKISGPIASLDSDDLARGCFDNPNFDLDNPLNGNTFCNALGFGADGQIPNTPTNPAVRTGFVNGQQIKFQGITGAVDYVTSLSGLGIGGALRLGGDMLYVRRRVDDITGVAPQRSDGIVGDPEFSGQARVVYSADRWGFGTYVNYTGEQLISRFNRGPSPNDTREFDQYDDFVTVNANIFFRTADNFRLNIAVTNLFDRIGQGYFGFIIPGSINDDIGRRFSVSVSKEF
ncbi:TonB-dependent receptor domain-containing protein [Erythrobacter sp. WG]|uniref:TonB-dependent receptor domain-containing protein n=1 Tax=Erythrobacter sp. WG TaxID=2985510 RepID=UPI002271D1F8|nr:TonB-dependent receptor [Erythrobacter sp. WG]MCX9147769.1 TonB-dependent receptor [Erythrobacter sp. WG]